MRMLILFLTLLSLSMVVALPGLQATAWAAAATTTASAGPRHAVQGRNKKRRPRAHKAKKTEEKKPKKNDRGFEL